MSCSIVELQVSLKATLRPVLDLTSGELVPYVHDCTSSPEHHQFYIYLVINVYE